MAMNSLPLLLPPPPIRSYDSHRRLISTAKRKETAAVRERWKQSQAATAMTSSRLRIHPQSAPPDLSASSRSVTSAIRKQLAYSRCEDNARRSATVERQPQFPAHEKEFYKSNLSERQPYFIPVQMDASPPWDYPSGHTSYRDVFFVAATGALQGDQSPRCKSARKERYFINPEWASESASWTRFRHRANPEQFRHSWM
ncbi:uncharacterized protein [Littorina saxatilis]|uniref:Uncharacterized protein n=1 Tax=Littorina saxatilis TaxID=31220 RepID=A0AAN9C3P9_9CAEN